MSPSVRSTSVVDGADEPDKGTAVTELTVIVAREFRSPQPQEEPEAHNLIASLHRIGWDRLLDPMSPRRLEELHQ